MARANAAHVFMRVDKSTDTPSVFELARPFPRLRRHEPYLRRGAIAAFVLFMVSLAFATGALLMQTHDDVITDAIDDLDMLAATAARTISMNMRDDRDPAAVLATLLPARMFARGRQIHVADRFGTIVASLPASAPSPKTMSDLFGPAHPLAVLADKAGVMRFTMADNNDALASVRNLDGRFGQIAMIYPLTDVLADWRAMALRAALLLGSTTLLLLGIGAAYLWQAERSAKAEDEAEGLRRRIDTALSRGRCGLWDWDIARGRIYWSPSMYDMLGMPTDTNYMSFGELRQLIHPADGDFSMIAEQLASSSRPVHRSHVPHPQRERRMGMVARPRRDRRRQGRKPASRRHRDRRDGAAPARGTHRRPRRPPARRHRDDLRSVRAVGFGQLPRPVQFEIPDAARHSAGCADRQPSVSPGDVERRAATDSGAGGCRRARGRARPHL